MTPTELLRHFSNFGPYQWGAQGGYSRGPFEQKIVYLTIKTTVNYDNRRLTTNEPFGGVVMTIATSLV